jgi:hypothetical protein
MNGIKIKLKTFLVGEVSTTSLNPMSSTTYTREFLTNLPIEMRKQYVEQQCREKIQYILGDARNGKTSSLVSIPDVNNRHGSYSQTPWTKNHPSKEEMAEFFQEKFPDCKISYEEMWVETLPGKKELKKGILVDWS